MQGNPMLRLLNRAHAYEAFILPRIEGREALYPDDLALANAFQSYDPQSLPLHHDCQPHR